MVFHKNHCEAVSREQKSKREIIDFNILIPILGTGTRILCQWDLDSGFQSLVGFRIPCAVFRIPKPRVPVSTSKILSKFGLHIS